MFAYINISEGNLIKSYKFDQQYLNMLLNNVQCTLCILICVLIICIFIFSSKSEITPTITPLLLEFIIICFSCAGRKEPDHNDKCLVELGESYYRFWIKNDNISFKQVGRDGGYLEEFYLTFCVENWFVTRSGPTPTWSGILPSTAMWRI